MIEEKELLAAERFQEIANDHFRVVIGGKFNPARAFICFEHIPTLVREQTRRGFTALDVVFD